MSGNKIESGNARSAAADNAGKEFSAGRTRGWLYGNMGYSQKEIS